MATKTISIDIEAYDRLCAVRKPEESFSQAIKRVIRKPISADEWFAKINAHAPLSDAEVEIYLASIGDKGPSSFSGKVNGNSRQHRHHRPDLASAKTGTAKARITAAKKAKRR